MRQQALYWVDILDQTVFRLRPTDGSVVTWQMPEMIGWLIERAHADGFVAGMQRDIVYLGLEPMTITPIGGRRGHGVSRPSAQWYSATTTLSETRV